MPRVSSVSSGAVTVRARARDAASRARAMRASSGRNDDARGEGAGGGASDSFALDDEGRRNRAIAVAGFASGVCAFAVSAWTGGSGDAVAAGANLARLEASSVPLDAALRSGKPTVVEFYADWCEVCKESAPTVYAVEREHANGVNFVMLNIDNVKWSEEMDTYGVDGIPHLEFLDARGESEGFIVGKFPREVLEKNVSALEAGEKTLPYAKQYGKASAAEPGVVPSADPRAPVSQATSADPRAHG